MNPLLAEFWPYLVLILVGFLPNEIWRLLGLVLARRLNEGAEILVWVRAVATAILAGVIGVFLAVPIAGIASVVVRYAQDRPPPDTALADAPAAAH